LRIHITGKAGAGKTTLAKQIASSLQLPLFFLDKVVWQPGWQKTKPARRDLLELALIDEPNWVIDGVSHAIRGASDLTIFLDVPRHVCLARCMRRNIPYMLRSRPELPENCPEFQILPQLLKIIWRFPDRVRPHILNDIENGANIIQIRDSRELEGVDLRRHQACS
jgi:adenylate kinase family enzyme